jgi:hypothetical protein
VPERARHLRHIFRRKSWPCAWKASASHDAGAFWLTSIDQGAKRIPIVRDDMSRIPTISEINELNRRYWEEQIPLRNRRIADEAIREAAFARLFDEQARGVPLCQIAGK